MYRLTRRNVQLASAVKAVFSFQLKKYDVSDSDSGL